MIGKGGLSRIQMDFPICLFHLCLHCSALMHATLVKIVIIINFVIPAMDGPFYRGWGTGGKGVYLCTPTTEGFRKQIVCTLPYATYCFSMPFHLFPVLGIRSSANMEVVL